MKVIMHKNCMDVAFMVNKLRRSKTGNFHLKGQWINLGYTGNPYFITKVEAIVIPIDAYMNDWVDISEKTELVRTKPGLPEDYAKKVD